QERKRSSRTWHQAVSSASNPSAEHGPWGDGRLRAADHPAYSNQMQLRDLLSRLLTRRSPRSGPAKTRYDAASRLEEKTQSHYRSVTESDAQGRSTKAGEDGVRPP